LRDVRDAKRSFGTAGGLLRYVGPEQDGVFETLVALIPLVPGGNDRISVIEAVGRFGARARDALPVLIDELPSHPHICTRVLGDLGPAAAPALSALDALSNHENEFVRKNVARAQFRIAGDPRGAHRVIEAGLRHGGRESLRALELCEDLGVAAAAYTAHLRERLDDADNWVAVQAAVALFAITKNAEAVVPTLLRHLEPVPSGFVALECLLRVGTAARAAEAALKGFIASPRRVVRFSVDDQLVLADERWVSLCRLALASFDRP
jgi:hypothetical protein